MPKEHLYTPFYCEENVWHLAQEPTLAALDKKVVFISNARHSCPLWAQRACRSPGEPIFWDYHVVLLGFDRHHWNVWDLDSLLGMPAGAADYIQRTFLPMGPPAPHLAPQFKLIDATDFVNSFSSDRRHMRNGNGEWLAPPPDWPAIMQSSNPNLEELIDMNDKGFGEVLDLEKLQERFASKQQSK